MPLKGAGSAQKEGTATKTREVLETTTAYNNILTHEGSLIYPSGKSMSFYLWATQLFHCLRLPCDQTRSASKMNEFHSKSIGFWFLMQLKNYLFSMKFVQYLVIRCLQNTAKKAWMHSFRCLSNIWRYNPIVGLYGSMNDAITALFIRWLLQETCNFILLLWSKQKVWVGLLAATFSNRIPLYDLCDTVWVCCALFKNKVLTTTCL